jgi:hypothetical protein
MLRTNKTPVLIDLGCAVRLSDASTPDNAWTPGYSAPELTAGAGKAGPWSDVYSCGATLYTMLSGRRPDDIDPSGQRSFPRASANANERRFRHAVLAALSPEPGDRPQTMSEFRELLGIERTAPEIAARASEPSQHSVFISYARKDSVRVEPFVKGLQVGGIKPWIDRAGIAPGSTWGEEIVRALRGARVVLVFCTGASMASENVAREIYMAGREKKRIVNVLLEDAPIPDAVAYYLTPTQHIDVRNTDPSVFTTQVRDVLSSVPA